eukprot:UN1075
MGAVCVPHRLVAILHDLPLVDVEVAYLDLAVHGGLLVEDVGLGVDNAALALGEVHVHGLPCPQDHLLVLWLVVDPAHVGALVAGPREVGVRPERVDLEGVLVLLHEVWVDHVVDRALLNDGGTLYEVPPGPVLERLLLLDDLFIRGPGWRHPTIGCRVDVLRLPHLENNAGQDHLSDSQGP